MNIVLFCGGRGSTALIKEIARWPDANLTLLVNAYDDGLSTGAIRNAIPGFLGPSDFRKNLVSTLLQSGEKHLEIARIMEHRLRVNNKEINSFREILNADAEFSLIWNSFSDFRKKELESHVTTFIRFLTSRNQIFEYEDCAVGNIIYGGAYLENGCNFQLANSKLCELIGVNANIVSVSNEETHLVGILTDGTILRDESSIVNLESEFEISDIFLLAHPLNVDQLEALGDLSFDEKQQFLMETSKIPDVTQESRDALENADLVVYGSGTQHSSLFPSYMVLSKNGVQPKAKIPRILILNLDWDFDIQGWDTKKFLEKFATSWDVESSGEIATHLLIDKSSPFAGSGLKDVELDGIVSIELNLRNASNPKVHSGFEVYRVIQEIYENSKEASDGGITFVASLNSSQKLREKLLTNEIEELHWPNKPEVKFKYSNNPEHILVEEYEYWLSSGQNRYFIGCTGHGQYAVGDVLSGLLNMPNSKSALIYGNRFRTRNEWILAKRTVFEERRFNQLVATFGSLLVNLIVIGKFRKSVADPFSRLFIIDRMSLPSSFGNLDVKNRESILGLYAHFWRSGLDTSEFHVKFRATFGESSDRRLIRQGMREIWKLLWT
jgi:2-phospho-L-lactate transferase/gluconeogenesis factor (CofD/UPF0052 family)